MVVGTHCKTDLRNCGCQRGLGYFQEAGGRGGGGCIRGPTLWGQYFLTFLFQGKQSRLVMIRVLIQLQE